MTPLVVVAMVCAWCPGFDPTAASNRGVSHGMCPTCAARAHAQIDAEVSRRLLQKGA